MSKTYDLVLLIILPIISLFISLVFKVNFLISILLVFGIPSVYLTFRTKRSIKKPAIFPIIFVPLGIVVDCLVHLDKSWYIPETVFSFRIFNILPLENIIWGYFLGYFIVIFYEYFIDKEKDTPFDKKTIILLSFSFLSLLIFLIFFYTNFIVLHISFFYLIVGIILILLPIILFLSFFPKLILKFILAGAYFSSLLLLFEIISLKLGFWVFPGENFVFWVKIFGQRFPFEELFFWIILIPITALCYYEFFADDRK